MKISGYKDTIGWYDNNAPQYAAKTQKNSRNDTLQLNEFSSLLPIHATILDAGCGGGRDTELLQQKGFVVTGIDISPNMIEEAKKAHPGCTFRVADMLALPFSDGNFDGIWAHASLVHFDNNEQIEKSIKEISRILKNGGIVHILVRAKKTKEKQILTDSLAKHERFYRNLSREELRNLLNKNNLEVVTLLQYDESKLAPEKRPGEGIEWIVVIAKKLAKTASLNTHSVL